LFRLGIAGRDYRGNIPLFPIPFPLSASRPAFQFRQAPLLDAKGFRRRSLAFARMLPDFAKQQLGVLFAKFA
jgi:hypothetical protein